MGNWHRYGSAGGRPALAAFEREADPAAQRRLADELQRIFVAEAPAIPLYPEPVLGRVQHQPLRGLPLARTSPTPIPRPTSSTGASACWCSPPLDPAVGGAHALHPPATRLLPARGVGGADAQLLPAAPHARRPGHRALRPLPRPACARRPCRRCARPSASPTRRSSSQYFTYLGHVLRGDFGISVAYFPSPVSAGDRHRASSGRSSWPAPRWSSASPSAPCSASRPPGGGAAGSTRGCPRPCVFLGAFPYFWLAMVALYVLGFTLGWFPLGHAYGDDLTPGLHRSPSSPTSSATPRCPSARWCWRRSAAGCSRCATR